MVSGLVKLWSRRVDELCSMTVGKFEMFKGNDMTKNQTPLKADVVVVGLADGRVKILHPDQVLRQVLFDLGVAFIYKLRYSLSAKTQNNPQN
jgi:hypothetical protein